MRLPARSAGVLTGSAVQRCRSPCHQLKLRIWWPDAVVQLLHPFLELRRGHDLADAVIAGGEIGRAEHAELVDEVRQPAAIDDHRDRRAGARLLQHVLVGAELRVREELYLDRAVRAGRDRVAKALQPLVERVGGGERGVDAERVVRRRCPALQASGPQAAPTTKRNSGACKSCHHLLPFVSANLFLLTGMVVWHIAECNRLVGSDARSRD